MLFAETRVGFAEHEAETIFLTAMGIFHSLPDVRHRLFFLLGTHIVVAPGEAIQVLEVLVQKIFLFDEVEGIFRFVVPVQGKVGECHAESGLGHYFRKPFEVLGDIEEGGGSTGEVTIVILRLAHCDPGVVEEGVELFAGAKCLLLG